MPSTTLEAPTKGLARNQDLAERNANIRVLAEAGWTQQEIADEYGITQSVVSYILRNPASEWYWEYTD
jgi:transcriptional regulator